MANKHGKKEKKKCTPNRIAITEGMKPLQMTGWNVNCPSHHGLRLLKKLATGLPHSLLPPA